MLFVFARTAQLRFKFVSLLEKNNQSDDINYYYSLSILSSTQLLNCQLHTQVSTTKCISLPCRLIRIALVPGEKLSPAIS